MVSEESLKKLPGLTEVSQGVKGTLGSLRGLLGGIGGRGRIRENLSIRFREIHCLGKISESSRDVPWKFYGDSGNFSSLRAPPGDPGRYKEGFKEMGRYGAVSKWVISEGYSGEMFGGYRRVQRRLVVLERIKNIQVGPWSSLNPSKITTS